MRIRLLYFFSFLLIASPCWSQAIEETEPPFISGIDLSIDILKLTSLATSFEQKYEGGAKVIFFEHIGLAFDLGYGQLEPERAIKNGNYTSEGTYFRAGLDYETKLDTKSNIYFGLRYGQSSFEDQGNYIITGQIEEDLETSFARSNLSADWFEVILGTEMRFFKDFYVGTIFRLRILGNYDAFEPIDVYAIPGYGRPFDATIPAANIYFKYRLNFN